MLSFKKQKEEIKEHRRNQFPYHTLGALHAQKETPYSLIYFSSIIFSLNLKIYLM